MSQSDVTLDVGFEIVPAGPDSRLRCQMVDNSDISHQSVELGLGHCREVTLNESESGVRDDFGDIVPFEPGVVVGIEIIYSDYPFTGGKQCIAEMRSDESGGARHQSLSVRRAHSEYPTEATARDECVSASVVRRNRA